MNQQSGLSTEQLAGMKSNPTSDPHHVGGTVDGAPGAGAANESQDRNRQEVHPTQIARPVGEANGHSMSRTEGMNGSHTGDHVALMAESEASGLRNRWNDIQSGFVDEPRRSVEQADSLVAETMQQLAKVFAAERSKLEEDWSRGSEVSTDDLRMALQKYRSFFQRLLTV